MSFFLAICSLFLVSCATYTEGTLGGVSGGGAQEDQFTVTLEYNDQVLPTADLSVEGLEVQITDGFSYYESKVGADGVARFKETEGSFKVTLTGLPEQYTYNPNVYTVSNQMPHIILSVYEVLKPRSGKGTNLYDCFEISKAGIYRATIKNAASKVYYQFRPTMSGQYGIESIIPTSVNKINPKAAIHIGTFAWKPTQPNYVLDTGGQKASYTKNFKYDVQLTSDMVGNVYTFVISATEKNGVYPLQVDFALVRVGEFTLETKNVQTVLPQSIPMYRSSADYMAFVNKHNGETRGKVWTNPESYNNETHNYYFDGEKFYYSEFDGFYHVDLDMDGDGGDAASGADPILYAKVSQASRFLDPLNTVENAGNKSLTIDEKNYKLFVEGYDSLVKKGYYCVYQPAYGIYCPCHMPDAGSCLEGCETCNPECTPCPPEQKDRLGYADVANADGACPVTQELKDFLQKYSVSQRLYNDGNGWAESKDPRIDSTHENQWLFACGYYL